MTFDKQPTLQGELVQLRPLSADDREELYAVAKDPLIWAQHPVRNRYERAAFDTFFDDALRCGGTLVVLEGDRGQMIGSSRFHGVSMERSEVEIGWTFLSRAYWGGRYNGELKRLMIAHAHQFVDTVVLLVSASNVRSVKAVEKIGGVRTGSRSDAGGRPSIVFSIRK